jgi:hypothetical protein
VSSSGGLGSARIFYADLTPPMKFKAQKLAAKLSSKCQVRCNDCVSEGVTTNSGSHVATGSKKLRTCL